MINLDHFINKTIFHGVCEINEMALSASLCQGVRFLGDISVSDNEEAGLTIYIPYVAEVDKPLRNFSFMVVKDDIAFVLPYNYTFIGHALIPIPAGGYNFMNVYGEKEL
jgi:hypothetical protein